MPIFNMNALKSGSCNSSNRTFLTSFFVASISSGDGPNFVNVFILVSESYVAIIFASTTLSPCCNFALPLAPPAALPRAANFAWMADRVYPLLSGVSAWVSSELSLPVNSSTNLMSSRIISRSPSISAFLIGYSITTFATFAFVILFTWISTANFLSANDAASWLSLCVWIARRYTDSVSSQACMASSYSFSVVKSVMLRVWSSRINLLRRASNLAIIISFFSQSFDDVGSCVMVS
mmetsp:Transcript_71847/g.105282  ORF Transcript_71847/g.105282 Transcript_71847/m.105282 type:complete len:236 (-) Transcript_71847:60-767(-)